MAKQIQIRHRIGMGDKWSRPSVGFKYWLPLGEEEALVRIEDNVITRLWLDRSCFPTLQEISDEDLSKHINIQLNKVFVDVILSVSDELVAFMWELRDAGKKRHDEIDPKHEDFGKLCTYNSLCDSVTKIAVTGFNRFIAYARNYKGHGRNIGRSALPLMAI